jgi:acyl-CoA synthetase (AMP-forming)/AMP-acid ligase II
MMMRGYWNSPAHQMPGGWFATGDVGFIAGDGMLHVLGRADRFLRLGAGLVSCSEVEDAIRAACPSMDVAALPLPDNERGDSLLVVAADWVDAPLLKNLLAYRFPALPEPRFVMRGTLPRTASGKVAYSQLLAETVSAG